MRSFKPVPKITQPTALALQTSKSQTTALLSPPVPPSSKSRYSFQRRHTQFKHFIFLSCIKFLFLWCAYPAGGRALVPFLLSTATVRVSRKPRGVAQFCVAPSVSREPPEVSVGFSPPRSPHLSPHTPWGAGERPGSSLRGGVTFRAPPCSSSASLQVWALLFGSRQCYRTAAFLDRVLKSIHFTIAFA